MVNQTLLFKHKGQLKVDLGDLQSEKDNLASFLHSRIKVDATRTNEGLTIKPEETLPLELKRAVNNFIYHRNLNVTHWVSLENDIVKINRFKDNKKKPKPKKQKKTPQHATITQSWGLG
jgi:hypothetical protein